LNDEIEEEVLEFIEEGEAESEEGDALDALTAALQAELSGDASDAEPAK